MVTPAIISIRDKVDICKLTTIHAENYNTNANTILTEHFMAVLTSNDQSVVRQKFDIETEPVVIGRHPECDVIIDDASVSRRHAQIVNDDGSFFLTDLESRNGTVLNNTTIQQATKLFDGAEIKICDVIFRFHLDDVGVFEQRPATVEQQSAAEHRSRNSLSSVIIEDDNPDALSSVMSRLDVPSHHKRNVEQANASQKLNALIQIAHSLSESVKRDEVLDTILTCLFDLFKDADRGFIIIRDEDGQLHPLGNKTRNRNEESLRISRTVVNNVMETRQPLITSDAAEDERFDLSQSIADFRLRSVMCVPLINSRDEPFGVIQLDTLKNRVAFKEDDLEILVTVAMQASLAIQKLDLIDEVLKNKQLEDDLKLAHEVQQAFLPQRKPKFDGYDFHSFYRATNEVGGDYYDYIRIDEDRLAVIVADVVGHGVAAALLMAKVAAESRYALASTKKAEPALKIINDNLSDLNLDRFATILLAIIDKKTNTFTYVNGGHMPPLIRRADGTVELLESDSGLPIGILSEQEYPANVLELKRGEVVIMFTDGINEAMNESGEQLGTEQVVSDIIESQSKSPTAIGKQICNTVNRHLGQEPPHDDMCFVCVGRSTDDPSTDG